MLHHIAVIKLIKLITLLLLMMQMKLFYLQTFQGKLSDIPRQVNISLCKKNTLSFFIHCHILWISDIDHLVSIIFTARCYAERGIATASRLSVRDVEVL